MPELLLFDALNITPHWSAFAQHERGELWSNRSGKPIKADSVNALFSHSKVLLQADVSFKWFLRGHFESVQG
jgi:hypothetical protein